MMILANNLSMCSSLDFLSGRFHARVLHIYIAYITALNIDGEYLRVSCTIPYTFAYIYSNQNDSHIISLVSLSNHTG